MAVKTKKTISTAGKGKQTDKKLVIIESPAKAKTLRKILGSGYTIEACVGHVRDLPKSQFGIDIENDFEPKYITIRGKGELLKKLRSAVKKADKVFLATDPDREGEAISWHLLKALSIDKDKYSRITFNEITKNAVTKSLKEARDIDMSLVDAQQARRVLDRVVGYKISPILWSKVKKRLSAGRVQSVVLRMICDRDDEIENFIPEEYWSIEAVLRDSKNNIVKAKYYGGESGKSELKDKKAADSVISAVGKSNLTVTEVKKSTRTKKPSPPFITSTMQQEAGRVCGMTAVKTMMLAQQLYEGVDIEGEGTVGLVSYIRTDSMRISDEAYDSLKDYIATAVGQEYLNPERQEHKQRSRAQDAHEAIRPTYIERTPESLKASLSRDQYKLYKLIWERFVASQMLPAVFDTVSVRLSANGQVFRASGSQMVFEGYKKIYKKNEDDSVSDSDSLLPELEVDQKLKLTELLPEQHFTQPPARYSEVLLVKSMEELGIGRPSTYAATISTINNRGYVTKDNKLFYPTDLGLIVNEIMRDNFDDVVDIDFTAKMEDDLDKIEDGQLVWKEPIRRFYVNFLPKLTLAESKIEHIEIEDEKTDVVCEKCGRNMVIKYSRYGKFLACPGYPECNNAKPFFEDSGIKCPLCGNRVLQKKTKKGRNYYGCESNPECEFMSWNKPTGENCPKCGKFLIEKGTKQKMTVCSDTQCDYRVLASEEAERA